MWWIDDSAPRLRVASSGLEVTVRRGGKPPGSSQRGGVAVGSLRGRRSGVASRVRAGRGGWLRGGSREVVERRDAGARRLSRAEAAGA